MVLASGAAEAASTLRDLPSWVQEAVASCSAQPPQDAEAWVLLDRLELSYHGDGEIRIRERRVVRVLSAVGETEAVFWRGGTGRNAGIRKLKGWNLRPDGELTKVDKGDLIGFDPDAAAQVTRNIVAATSLRGVVKGSLVAYESECISGTLGPAYLVMPQESYPVHRFELLPRAEEAFSLGRKDLPMVLDTRHFSPWIPEPAFGARELRLTDLPALPRNEWAHGGMRAWQPTIWVHYEDPALTDLPQAGSWDRLASWYSGRFARETDLAWPLPGSPANDREALQALDRWMKREFRYQQVYLRADRGWIPEKARELVRKRYGDCKDLAAVFIGAAGARGLKACPVLARVFESPITVEEPPSTTAFNHAIVALHLEKSLGFPAEVETPQGRFLLVDPTARLTPVGWLPAAHRHGRVMVCTPGGAVWIHIPDSAIEPLSLRIAVKGGLQADALQGEVRLTEEGNQEGLRESALFQTPDQLKAKVVNLMGLPPVARLELRRKGDPLDLDQPFALEYTLELPRPLSRLGQEYELGDMGFPGIAAPIQPKGCPRKLPVVVEGAGTWQLDLDLGLGSTGLGPVGLGRTLETPFRKVQWISRLEQGRLRLELRQETHRAVWDMAHREEGVAAQRKDRSALKSLLDDARTLVPQTR